MAQAGAVTREFEAQYPQCGDVLVGKAAQDGADGAAPVPFLSATCRRMPRADEVKRINAWLKVRSGMSDARVVLVAGRPQTVRRPAPGP